MFYSSFDKATSMFEAPNYTLSQAKGYIQLHPFKGPFENSLDYAFLMFSKIMQNFEANSGVNSHVCMKSKPHIYL